MESDISIIDQSFRGWKILKRFPAAGGEADIFLVGQTREQRIIIIFRYGITPKPEVFEKLVRLTETNQNL